MNSIFHDVIDEYIVKYMADLLIFSESREEYLKHLKAVLKRLRDYELYVGEEMFIFRG